MKNSDKTINFKNESNIDNGITLKQQRFINDICKNNYEYKNLVKSLGVLLNDKTNASFIISKFLSEKALCDLKEQAETLNKFEQAGKRIMNVS